MIRETVFLSLFTLLNVGFSQINQTTFISFGNTKLDVSSIKEEVKSISPGLYHCNFLMKDGSVKSVVDPNAVGLDVPLVEVKARSISTGDVHSVMVLPDSSILQYFSTTAYDMFYPNRLKGIKEVCTSSVMSSALTQDSILYTWGKGNVLQRNGVYPVIYGVESAVLGKTYNAFIHRSQKVFVSGNSSSNIKSIPEFKNRPVKITSGDDHILVLDAKGKVYAWGNSQDGQCDLPGELKGAKRIYANGNVSAVLDSNNVLYLFGQGVFNKIDLAKTNVKAIGLGKNYLVISSQYNSKRFLKEKFSDVFPLAGKSKLGIARGKVSTFQYSPKDFFYTVSKNGFGQNKIVVKSSNSTFQGSQKSETSFEGVNNEVTIINDGVKFKAGSGTQRVIFKGSNNNVVIRSSGEAYGSNKDETVIVDLDKLNKRNGRGSNESIYYRKGSSSLRKKMENATSMSEFKSYGYKLNPYKNKRFSDEKLNKMLVEYRELQRGYWVDTLTGYSAIEDFPVKDGKYVLWGEEYEVNNELKIESVLDVQEYGGFTSGQYYLYKNDVETAIQKWRLGIGLFDYRSILALEQLYVEGKYVSKDLKESEKYKNKYKEFLVAEKEYLINRKKQLQRILREAQKL